MAGVGFLVITLSHHPEVTVQHVLLLLTTIVIGLMPLTLERQRRPTEPEMCGDTSP
jgi:ABC-type enterochelin transport system permease subunit